VDRPVTRVMKTSTDLRELGAGEAHTITCMKLEIIITTRRRNERL
jgi:hypothetical protein